MDSLVESAIRSCIACQAVTPGPRRDPLQMTPLPAEPWQLVAADIFGPLPSGEKILVLKCLRSKWPEISVFLRNQATNADGVISAMEKLFAIHGIPDVIRTDNGPPFNSKAFKQFSKQFGFRTQKVTPLWPEANGQAESFMKCLGKIVRTAYIENRDWKKALNSFLMAYRATPHPSTGVSPANVLYPGRRFKTLLPCQAPSKADRRALSRFNEKAMAQAKLYADRKRNAQPNTFVLGDTVLVRQQKRNKLSSYYDPAPFKIVAMNGTMLTAERQGKQIVRNSSFFKKIPSTTAPLSNSRPTSSVPPGNAGELSTQLFLCPPSSNGGQQGAANPAVPMPEVPVESDDEFVDAEADVEQPEVNDAAFPAQIDPAPEPAGLPLADAAVAEDNPAPILPGFHPPANAPMANVPFLLLPDIRPNRYNLRERTERNS